MNAQRSVDAMAAEIYLATAASASTHSYESLPAEARAGYRALVDNLVIRELRELSSYFEEWADSAKANWSSSERSMLMHCSTAIWARAQKLSDGAS